MKKTMTKLPIALIAFVVMLGIAFGASFAGLSRAKADIIHTEPFKPEDGSYVVPVQIYADYSAVEGVPGLNGGHTIEDIGYTESLAKLYVEAQYDESVGLLTFSVPVANLFLYTRLCGYVDGERVGFYAPAAAFYDAFNGGYGFNGNAYYSVSGYYNTFNWDGNAGEPTVVLNADNVAVEYSMRFGDAAAVEEYLFGIDNFAPGQRPFLTMPYVDLEAFCSEQSGVENTFDSELQYLSADRWGNEIVRYFFFSEQLASENFYTSSFSFPDEYHYTSDFYGGAIMGPFSTPDNTFLEIFENYTPLTWQNEQYRTTTNFTGNNAALSDVNGYLMGSEYTYENLSSGGQVELPPEPVKEGFTFIGWYLDEAFTVPYTDQPLYEDTVLYAKFQINTFTVTFVTNGGSTCAPATVNWNTVPTLPSPTKTGYAFSGWFTNTGLTTAYNNAPIKANTTLYAKWLIHTYNVSLNVNGGNALSPVKADYNTTPTIPSATRTGYTFSGWFTDSAFTAAYTSKPITGDFTLYAKWTIITYTVTLNVNGGNVLSPVKADYNTKPTIPSATRAGYAFAGWFTDSALTAAYTSKPITGNFTLYAKWTINRYTITLNSNGGTAFAPITLDYNATPTLPSPVKTGYTFGGWFTNEALTTKYTAAPLTGNMTLYAKWTINTYIVTFDSQGGSTVDPASVVYNTALTFPTAPTRTGYTFRGWTLSGKLLTEYVVTGNATMIASWVPIKVTVTFMVDGKVYTTLEVDYGTTLTEAAKAAQIDVSAVSMSDGSMPVYDGDEVILTGAAVLEGKPAPKVTETATPGMAGIAWYYWAIGGVVLLAVASLLMVALRRRT